MEIMNLPKDIWHEILLCFENVKDFVHFSLVSQKCKQIIDQKNILSIWCKIVNQYSVRKDDWISLFYFATKENSQFFKKYCNERYDSNERYLKFYFKSIPKEQFCVYWKSPLECDSSSKEKKFICYFHYLNGKIIARLIYEKPPEQLSPSIVFFDEKEIRIRSTDPFFSNFGPKEYLSTLSIELKKQILFNIKKHFLKLIDVATFSSWTTSQANGPVEYVVPFNRIQNRPKENTAKILTIIIHNEN